MPTQWRFESGHPEVPERRSVHCVVLVENAGGRFRVDEAFYINGESFEFEDCVCGEHDNDAGECVLRGWYTIKAHYDYDEYYEPLQGIVHGYVVFPTAEEARAAICGPW